MPTAKSIVASLIKRGIIPAEFREEAEQELHRELSRRTRRVCLTLASRVSAVQFATKLVTAFAE